MLPSSRAAAPHPLLARLHYARRLTDSLLACARPSRLLERPIAERHRFIFYLGHLDAFDWNLLGRRLGLNGTHPFDTLFDFGIDPIASGLPQEEAYAWPPVHEIDAYLAARRNSLDRALPPALVNDRRDRQTPPLSFVLEAAIEHRLMHAETLAYMIDHSSIERPLRRRPTRRQPETRFRAVPAGTATLGRERDDWRSFGWDNEYAAHSVAVDAFEIMQCMVSNGDYLRFVDAGGYQEPALWSPADWQWLRARDLTHPLSWQRHIDGWYQRTPSEHLPLPLDWPVYVSHAEASAYARWIGAALPTEAQWHRAAYGDPDGVERFYPWGTAPPSTRHGNFDFLDSHPHAVDAHLDGASAFGLVGLLGNGWEWTSTRFAALPGFEPFDFYPGYSADFFDDRHYVLKGGGPFTDAAFLRRSFRNWFQPHYPYAQAGFRCVAKP